MIAMIGTPIRAPLHPMGAPPTTAPSSRGYGDLKAAILRECARPMTARQIAERLDRPLSVVKATLAWMLGQNLVRASREGRGREYTYRSVQ